MSLKEKLNELVERLGSLEEAMKGIREEMNELRKQAGGEDSPQMELMAELVPDVNKQHVLLRAVEVGLLEWAPGGKLRSCMGSKTLMAYFIGRLWSYDEVGEDKVMHEKIWVQCSCFPSKLVKQLFGEEGLRDLRKNRRNMPLPQGYEKIESLFNMGYGMG